MEERKSSLPLVAMPRRRVKSDGGGGGGCILFSTPGSTPTTVAASLAVYELVDR